MEVQWFMICCTEVMHSIPDPLELVPGFTIQTLSGPRRPNCSKENWIDSTAFSIRACSSSLGWFHTWPLKAAHFRCQWTPCPTATPPSRACRRWALESGPESKPQRVSSPMSEYSRRVSQCSGDSLQTFVDRVLLQASSTNWGSRSRSQCSTAYNAWERAVILQMYLPIPRPASWARLILRCSNRIFRAAPRWKSCTKSSLSEI
mmetsp:Transcript_133695/g.303266  ORF Transcript_133695/g.303266 Transcript_133695/m.303266 type:complete len:204 (+) Transcript_133695:1364-1975(+)